MKKNGYLRRFLALFLALVMIMADSSVTTFAATVGRVKQKSAASESSSQYSIQVNIPSELDLENIEYKYLTLGTKELYQAAVPKSDVVPLHAGTINLTTNEKGNFNLYLVKGLYSYQMDDVLQDGSKFKQGKNKFKVHITADSNNANNLTLNIEKLQSQPQAGPTVDYKSILGNSLHFGIVANDFTCKGDLEANLAVGTLHGSGSMKSSKNDGGNGTTLIGDYVDSGWYIFKNPEGGKGDLILYTTKEAAARFGSEIKDKEVDIDTETYSKEEIQEIVRNLVAEAADTSDILADNAEQYGVKYSDAEENGVLDLTELADGTYYINFENGEYEKSNLKFKITSGQNIVLNIPDTSVKLKTYGLSIDGQNCKIDGYANGGYGEKACENIIFNLKNASSVTSEQIHGVVLVPHGSFENGAVGAGWIIADSVTSGRTEWHCLSRDIPVVTSYAIKAKKTVNGKAPSGNEAGKFTFKLYKIDDKGNETLVDTKSNGDGGLVSFDTFGNITETGTYWYKITEEGTVAGYTIDTTVYYAEVVVNATPSNGVIISKNAKVTYHKGTKTGNTATVATFNNIKKEDETSVNIKVKKTFTNGAADKKFNFVLTPINNAPMPEGAVNGKKTISVSQNDGVQNFGEIKYTTAGTYSYEVVEDSSEQAAGITYDNHRWTVTVTVPADFSTPTVTYSSNDGTISTIGAEFTNSEENKETEITLAGSKSLSGRDLTAGEFNFQVKENDKVVATGKNDADGTIRFSKINYPLSGLSDGNGGYESKKTYEYTVNEVIPEGATAENNYTVNGVTYDNSIFTVKVIVSYDQATGIMSAAFAEDSQELIFDNTYDAKGSLTLEASKTLKNKALEADAFNFVLKDENGETIQTVANDANGNVTFRPLNYTLEDVGLHTYTVSEVQKADAEVTYDTTVYTVAVTVADAGDGTLNVSKTIKKGSDTPGTMIFENIYKGVIEISGTKNWADENNQDGIRPTSITVNLFANGKKVADQKVTPDANGNWSYVFRNLPQYDVNGEITYTVTEDVVDGYETSVNGYNITNTHKTETIDITGTKTWNDSDNQDGKRPESITVNLLADGKITATKTVTATDNWTYSFTDLPKYANGQEITYTVAEEEVTDYTTTYDGSNITNSYTPGKTSATVTKIWNDAENQDGKRPESITVSLLADGKETGKTVTLSAENNWTQTVSGLPEKAEGKAIEYTWTEETLPEGYKLTDNSKTGTVTTLTNTYVPETTFITVTKNWDDADNQDGKRPESIIVNLLANGEIAASQTVKADEAGNWTYTFKDLPKYANGKEITYTVTEEAVEGYETSVDGFNITNAYTTETTEVKGSKTWNDSDNQDGKRPESITVRLLANGEEKDSQTVTADENGNWTYSFENLPKYEAGKEIVYTVTEDAVADYTTEITGYDITNSYAPGKTSVTVTKAWADNDNRGGYRPKEIKVQLKVDGENSGEEITLNAENKWTYTWSELDEKKAGKDIVYTVEEIGKTAGYISTVTGNATEGFIITNTITSVKISKVDITDQKELAGAHIQILDKDGNVVDEWDSTWESHEVTGLKTGEKYTLRETVAPDGYTITADTVFSLKEDGTLDKDNTSTTISADGTLLVEDSRTSVKVSKVDISDGEELEGAHIQIIDQDGNVVDEWDSTKEAHVTEKLKIGKTYTLRETVAPDGYLLTSDTTFVLKEDGTVDAEKTTAVSKDGVLLVQDKLATSASIAVTKKLTYIGESLAARDQTFYVALYSDQECTQRVSDVKALVFKNADASTVVFSENIKAGKTYYIAECTQDGTAQTIGALADGTVYEAVFGNGNSTTVTEVNGTTTVSFENVFSSFPPDGFYKQGQLTITKKVLGADGGTRNSNEVFYAGIFDDAAHTQLSQQVEQNIIKLDMDGGYEVSETINVGLAQSGAKVTLYVTETDSNGKPIAGSEGFGYKVTVSADSVTLDETNMTAEVVITNQEESTVTETPTPTPSSDGGNSGGSENHSGGYGGGKSPKTGDDTPIGTYLMLLLAAAMLAAETERRRRRNKRQ